MFNFFKIQLSDTLLPHVLFKQDISSPNHIPVMDLLPYLCDPCGVTIPPCVKISSSLCFWVCEFTNSPWHSVLYSTFIPSVLCWIVKDTASAILLSAHVLFSVLSSSQLYLSSFLPSLHISVFGPPDRVSEFPAKSILPRVCRCVRYPFPVTLCSDGPENQTLLFDTM